MRVGSTGLSGRCRICHQSASAQGDPKCPETPTFGRYAEIPYEQMTREQQESYRLLIETRGALGGPNKIWVHNPYERKKRAETMVNLLC